jgi:bromodomain adjacent to zinc finger domain protein 1A
VEAKPEKRYPSLHHSFKVEILSWLCELVAITGIVRDFLEESLAGLTEVRKEQVEVKREWKRV